MTFQPLPDFTLTGSTLGTIVGESIELVKAGPLGGPGPSNAYFTLTNGNSATVEIRVSANGYILTSTASQSFVQRLVINRIGNVTTIAAQDTLDQFGSPGASSWTFAVTIGTSPDRLLLTFTTGSTQAVVNVTADIFVTQAVTPAAPSITLFKGLQAIYYDPVHDLIYVGDVAQPSAIIPVMNSSGSTNTVINVPASAGWGSGSNNGAARFYADSTYVYAMPSGHGSSYIVLINRATRAVVGYMNPFWSGTQYFSFSMVTDGTYVYAATSDQFLTNGANIQQFRISDAISSFPTAATPIAANTDSVNNGGGPQPWLARQIAYDGSFLWLASNYNITSGYAGDFENVYKVNTSLVTQTITKYNSANTYPSTEDLEFIFGSIIWSVFGNALSPYQTFSGSTAQIWKADAGTPFITFPVTAPYGAGFLSGGIFSDPIDSTMIAFFNSGSLQFFARYNSSGTLVSTVPAAPTIPGQYLGFCAVTSTNSLWLAGFNTSSGFQSTIDVYSHTLGSETLQFQILGF